MILWNIFLFMLNKIMLKHTRNDNSLYFNEKLNKLSKNNSTSPLEKEFERATNLDHQIRRILSRRITDESLHNPNTPIFRPYDLTEEQQDILLSHD